MAGSQQKFKYLLRIRLSMAQILKDFLSMHDLVTWVSSFDKLVPVVKWECEVVDSVHKLKLVFYN